MPSAKAAFDGDDDWKNPNLSAEKLDRIIARLSEELRPFFPNKSAVESEIYGNPADAWVASSVSEARSAIVSTFGLGLRLTNQQLLVEQKEIFTLLKKVAHALESVSPDVDRLFGVKADVLGTRDKIMELLPHVEASQTRIKALPKALKRNEVERAAAVEVAVRVLRIFKDRGGRISATADADTDQVSDAVKILKIMGDELGLCFSMATWKKTVISAMEQAKDLKKVRKAPKKSGA